MIPETSPGMVPEEREKVVQASRRGLAALLVLSAFVAFGVALRLLHPDHAYFWLDEVWTAMHSTGHGLMDVVAFTEQTKLLMAGDFLPFLRHDEHAGFGNFIRTDPHTSPLYYTLCWGTIKMLGDHVLATRLLTAVIGCLALGCVYLAAREVTGSRLGGGLALILSSVSPVLVYWCYESRPYSLWLASIALSTYAFSSASSGTQRWKWWAYGSSGVLLVYSHLYGIFVLLAHAAYLVAGRAARDVWWRFGKALAAVALSATPWCVAILSRLDAVHDLTEWQSQPVPASESLSRLRAGLLSQFGSTAALRHIPFGAAFLTLLAVAVPVAAFLQCRRELGSGVAAMLGVMSLSLPLVLAGVDAVAGGQRASIVRYYIASSFAVVLLVAWFGASCWQRWRAGTATWGARFGLALTALLIGTSACGAWTQFQARVPEGKPNAFVVDMAEAITRAPNPLVLSAGMVTTPLILANALPSTTPVYSMRWHDVTAPSLASMVREHSVFVLAPTPDIYEPRRQEAVHTIQRLSTRFRLVPVAGACCMYQLTE